MAIKIDTTITVGNLLSIVGMLAAIVIFVISLNFTSNANREDIKELKQTVKEIQNTVNAIDKRLAVLEERTNRVPVAW
jgi:uncharacterized protein YoxC